MAFGRAIRQPAIPSTKSQRNSVPLSERSRGQAQQGSQFRSSSTLRIQEDSRGTGTDQQVELSDQDSVIGPGFHSPSASTQLPSRASAEIQRCSEGWTRTGPVPIVPLCSRRPGPGSRPHSRCGTATGGASCSKISDLGLQNSPGVEATHWGYRFNPPKAEESRCTSG